MFICVFINDHYQRSLNTDGYRYMNVYYAAINLSCYYAAVVFPFKVYFYAAINFKSILFCYYAAIIRIAA